MKYTLNIEVLSCDTLDAFELAEWIEEILQASIESVDGHIRISVPSSVKVEYC